MCLVSGCNGFGYMNNDEKYNELMAEIRKLRQFEDELINIRTGMLRYQALVNEYWISDETEDINDLIDKMSCKIKRIADELYDISRDVFRSLEEAPKE